MTPQYAAGYFDAGGCVNITVSGKARQACLRVMLSNADRGILEYFYAQFGGELSKPRRLGKLTWRRFNQVKLTGHKAAAFLLYVEPHVIAKASQVRLALEFWKFQQLPKRARCKSVMNENGRVTMIRKPEVIEKELAFKKRMHELNKRGAA